MIELRDFLSEDEDILVSYLNEEAVTKYLSARLPQPYTKEAAAWWVSTGSKMGIVKAITHNGILVGSISALPGEFERQKSAEVGYWVAKPYWGKGIASEALKQFTELVFKNTDLIKLYASVFGENLASAKVLEKCGFKFEAVLEKVIFKNNNIFDELYYSKIRS